MQETKLSSIDSTGLTNETKNKLKKPEEVIGLLREFNFGSPDEAAQAAVVRFLWFIKNRHLVDENFYSGEFPIIDLIIDELEKDGFAEPGTISREKWTKEATQALVVALRDFEQRREEWQKSVNEAHLKAGKHLKV